MNKFLDMLYCMFSAIVVAVFLIVIGIDEEMCIVISAVTIILLFIFALSHLR